MKASRRKGSNDIVLPPVRPNAGIQAAYRARLQRLVADMHRSVSYWVTAVYRANAPRVATDAPIPIVDAKFASGGARPWQAVVNGEVLVTKKGSPRWFKTELAARAAARIAVGEVLPAAELAAALADIGEKWRERFDDAAPRLGDWFSQQVDERSATVLRRILREGGVSVRFQPTPASLDVLAATTAQNVSLIKSIPEQYLTNVEGLVMRSVQEGRDLGPLAKALEEQFGVTKRRAAFIARDQNNKATATLTRVRQTEAGIVEAEWMHSGGGREPRPTHVANDGKRYNIRDGWYDPAIRKRIWPGTEPNCRCVQRAIIPGLSR